MHHHHHSPALQSHRGYIPLPIWTIPILCLSRVVWSCFVAPWHQLLSCNILHRQVFGGIALAVAIVAALSALALGNVSASYLFTHL